MTKQLGMGRTAFEALRGVSLQGKTAIVTGGNQGLGKETVLALASASCRVILTSRDVSAGDTAASELANDPAVSGQGTIIVKQLDLADLQSINAFVKDIVETEPTLDLLVCNAGIMHCPKGLTKNAMHRVREPCDHGSVQIRIPNGDEPPRLLDKMKASQQPSRVVVVSSSFHKKGQVEKHIEDLHFTQTKYNKEVAYANSKSANVLFVRELSKRLQGSTVQAFALEPGVVPTQLTRHYGVVGTIFRAGLGKLLFSSEWKTKAQGAATTVHACVAPELKGQPGAYLKNCAVVPVTHKECIDDALSARLWQASPLLVSVDC